MRLICTVFLAFWACMVGYIQAQTDAQILETLRLRQYNRAATQLEHFQGSYRPLYQAMVDAAFNQPELSLQALADIDVSSYTDSMKFVYCRLQYDNFVKVFDYANAYRTGQTLVTNYKSMLGEANWREELDALKIWKCLEDLPPPTTQKTADCAFPFEKDMAGLHTMPVQIKNKSFKFIFDTGAGLNCITETYAKKLQVRIVSQEPINVKGGNGSDNNVKVGIMPLLQFGDISVRNSVFLVFPDKAFRFGGVYQINGIIGFPIIESLGAITLKTDSIFIPKIVQQLPQTHHNMAFEELSPLIYVQAFDQEFPCLFDTGDNDFSFSKAFYDAFSDRLVGHKSTIVDGSAGGKKEYNVFIANTFPIQIDKKILTPDAIVIHTDDHSIVGESIYGSIGQGILRHFKSTTIDFVNAQIWLR